MKQSLPIAEICGYVLAGGRSSRMGTDKALLELAGKPLIAHAVTKLRRICAAVRILSSNHELAQYAPLVPDLHPGCGPIGGIEAALQYTPHDWNLILPVDLPLLPTAFLETWVTDTVQRSRMGRIRVAFFNVFGLPQPTLLLIHRSAAPYIATAVADGNFKLLSALEFAARELAPLTASFPEPVPYVLPINEDLHFPGRAEHPGAAWHVLTPEQRAIKPLWFANLNTSEDFAEAEAHANALDT